MRVRMNVPSVSREPSSTILLYPLNELYALASRALPDIEIVGGDSMPQPYRQLLVHNGDMTSTLERFHGERLAANVLNRLRFKDAYFREVILVAPSTGEPVEFAAARIDLTCCPREARHRILEERVPLGTILADCGVRHMSRPTAYLKTLADEFIARSLQLENADVLWGRRNTLLTKEGQALAEVVEFLPPGCRCRRQI